MEASSAAIAGGCRAPLAKRQHSRLVSLIDRLGAVLAAVPRAGAVTVGPLHLWPSQALIRAAVRAGNEVEALIAFVERLGDPRRALIGRRRHEIDFAPAAKGDCALDSQRDRIAFAVRVVREAVNLVEEQIARWHRSKADGAVRPDEGHLATGE